MASTLMGVSKIPQWDYRDRDSTVFRKAHRERALEETAPRSLVSKWSEANGIAGDLLSISRNTLAAGAAASGTAAKVANVIRASAIMSGVLNFLGGGNLFRVSIPKIAKDYERGDLERGGLHGGDAFIGVACATLGAGMVAQQAAMFAHAAAAASVGAMMATVSVSALFSAFGITAGYGLAVNHSFRRQLNQILDRQGSSGALVWLQEQVCAGGRETQLHKKWDRFAFRTSEACCQLLRESIVSGLRERLEAGDRGAIQEVKMIIQEVKRANGKQLAKFSLLMTITILGSTAFICSIVFTGPIALIVFPLLFAISALLSLGLDSQWIHEKWGNFWCGKSLIPAPQIPNKSSCMVSISLR